MDAFKVENTKYEGKMPPYIYKMVTINTHYDKPPEDENLQDFLTNTFCNVFEYKSFPFIVIIIQIFIFFLLCCFSQQFTMTFLGINSLTLSKFGALDIYQLQEGYVWELITTSFLNQNSIFLICNSLVILLYGCQIYELYDNKACILVYFIGIISGNLTYINLANDIVVGSQFAVFSLFGGLIAHWQINYDELNIENPCAKWMMYLNTFSFMSIFLIGINQNFMLTEFISFFIGAFVMNALYNKNDKKKYGSIIFLIIYNSGLLATAFLKQV